MSLRRKQVQTHKKKTITPVTNLEPKVHDQMNHPNVHKYCGNQTPALIGRARYTSHAAHVVQTVHIGAKLLVFVPRADEGKRTTKI
jgi:hypothetical protein